METNPNYIGLTLRAQKTTTYKASSVTRVMHIFVKVSGRGRARGHFVVIGKTSIRKVGVIPLRRASKSA
jgi:hypothetical protein